MIRSLYTIILFKKTLSMPALSKEILIFLCVSVVKIFLDWLSKKSFGVLTTLKVFLFWAGCTNFFLFSMMLMLWLWLNPGCSWCKCWWEWWWWWCWWVWLGWEWWWWWWCVDFSWSSLSLQKSSVHMLCFCFFLTRVFFFGRDMGLVVVIGSFTTLSWIPCAVW